MALLSSVPALKMISSLPVSVTALPLIVRLLSAANVKAPVEVNAAPPGFPLLAVILKFPTEEDKLPVRLTLLAPSIVRAFALEAARVTS